MLIAILNVASTCSTFCGSLILNQRRHGENFVGAAENCDARARARATGRADRMFFARTQESADRRAAGGENDVFTVTRHLAYGYALIDA